MTLRPRDPRPSSKAVMLLATTFVLLGGLVTLTFMIVTATDDPLPKVLTVAAATVVAAVVLWIFRDRPPGHPSRWEFGWFRGRSVSHAAGRYQLRKVRHIPETAAHPPTADELREVSQNTSTWVPSARPRKAE